MVYDSSKANNGTLTAAEWNAVAGDIMNGIEHDVYVPYLARLTENSHVYASGSYLVCRSKVCSGSAAVSGSQIWDVLPRDLLDEHCSFVTTKLYSFGTYQWYGYCNLTNYGQEYPGGFELCHGYPNEGLITFMHITSEGGSAEHYYAWNTYGGTSTQTEITLTGSWKTPRLFGIVWSATAVDYYLDSVLVAHNTTGVPQNSMGFFYEAMTNRNVYTGSPATREAIAYFKMNSLQKTA